MVDNGDDGQASATYDNNGGGNHTTQYCLAAFDASNPPMPYEITNFLQH